MAKLHYISNPKGLGFSTRDVILKHCINEIKDNILAIHEIVGEPYEVFGILEQVLSECGYHL